MSEETYFCQSANLKESTFPLSKWDVRVRQHFWDIRSGNYGSVEYIQEFLLTWRDDIIWMLGGKGYTRHAPIRGRCTQTPVQSLGLKPGELVEVKRIEEIIATLDSRGKNRGLVFNREMVRYCGMKLRVARRVDRMINEKTGQMRKISNTVILEGVTCDGKDHRGCQRNCYSLWREIWLRRVDNSHEK